MTIDLSPHLAAKSDQLNADDLIGGDMIITVTGVRVLQKGAEQPIIVSYQNDGGKPWKPCKSMARVLVHCWGADASKYAGRSIKLYRDPNVRFGADLVGGIRVRALSHINGPMQMPLTVTRGKKAGYKVDPLTAPAQTSTSTIEQARAVLEAARSMDELVAAWRSPEVKPHQATLKPYLDELKVPFEASSTQSPSDGGADETKYDGV